MYLISSIKYRTEYNEQMLHRTEVLAKAIVKRYTKDLGQPIEEESKELPKPSTICLLPNS